MEVPPENNQGNGNQMNANESEAGQPEEDDAPAAIDTAEDLQNAWENLDLARSIVSQLVQDFHPQAESDSSPSSNPIKLKSTLPKSDTASYTKDEQSELLLDLAQIHTRLGDLQRANAN